MRNWLGISGEEARGLQVTWALPGTAPRATSVEGVGGADGTRNTCSADCERAGGPDDARNAGGAANETPVAQQQCGYARGPEASRRLRASRQDSLVVDEIQPRAALTH